MFNQNPDLPAFDMLVGHAATPPYPGFGDIVQDPRELEKELHAKAAEMRQEIRNTFGVKLEGPSSIPRELDDIIEEMWETGWDPGLNDLNLFTRTFGSLLTEAVLELLGGRPIFRRSGDNGYIHDSVLWPGVEAFPYHKAFKCLTKSDGETMAFFVRGVGGALEEKGLLMPETKARVPKPRYSSRGD